MSNLSREADAQQPAATLPHSMAGETVATGESNALFDHTLRRLETHKDYVIRDIRDRVEAYFVGMPVHTSLNLVEISQRRATDGSVRGKYVDSDPLSDLRSSETRLRAFVEQQQQEEQEQQQEASRAPPGARYIDSAHTRSVQWIVEDRFKQLYQHHDLEVAACFIGSQLLLAEKRTRLCFHFREHVSRARMPLTNEQRTALRSASDDDIIQKALKLGDYINMEHYARGFPPPRPRDPSFRSLRAIRGEISRTLDRHSLTELSSFPSQLGDKVANALAEDLDLSFKDRNSQLLAMLCLGDTDGILQRWVEAVVSPDSAASIAYRIMEPSPESLAALAKNDRSAVEELIFKDIGAISVGKYFWLKELKGLGVSDADMAELVLQEYNNSPWVVDKGIESIKKLPASKPRFNHHIPGCIHSIPWDGGEGVDDGSSTTSLLHGVPPSSFQDMDIASQLQSQCGLGGVMPTPGGEESWNGTVSFGGSSGDRTATVTFKAQAGSPEGLDHVLRRMIVALECLCSAFATAQDHGLCCSSYTALRLGERANGVIIEACRIEIETAWHILEILRSAADQPLVSTFEAVSELFDNGGPLYIALLPVLGNLPTAPMSRTLCSFHLCSLAIQFLSLAFLSYSQAHKGDLSPSFLMEPLQRVLLSGIDLPGSPVIHMERKSLTCMGNMLNGPVLCFKFPSSTNNLSWTRLPVYDLYANLADVVDTWGPAEMLCLEGESMPFAMHIRGGMLYREDGEQAMYHWSETVDVRKVSRKTFPQDKILIGAVRVNEDCQSNMQKLRDQSTLRPLGTQQRKFRPRIDNIVFSFGHHVGVKLPVSLKWNQGRSRKEEDKEWAQKDVQSLLNDYSGVQVSFCTGICRRVRLRDAVADLLLLFPDIVSSAATLRHGSA
ncbi:hypothetical protein NLG97_g10034 [Lecanicillium saksenae]|uniref:Uncharacterized protein n=1 Tax=Lecanicillium saksenae TaxID=468837 RepID=A0ACC1QFM3_9HYPO|nr:hypothetical protein NLG97_g10034 [Lecanicillium saksenae]